MNTFDILKTLCKINYVTGKEDCFFSAVKSCADENSTICRDNMGNIILKTVNENAQNKIVIDAHCDRIGFVVTELLGEGFVRLAPVGSIDERTLLSARLISVKGSVSGVFACIPPHLQKSGDDKSFPSLSDLALDTGLNSDELKKAVSIGDFFCFESCGESLNENIFVSAALDNLAGVSAAISAFNEACKSELKNTSLTLLLSIGEELGLRGAKAFSGGLDSNAVICIDVSFAAFPCAPSDKTGELGGGVMLGVGPILSKELKTKFESAAERLGMPLQHEILPETTGTNADVLTLCSGGAHCALLSIPIRNMHTQSELVDIRDIERCSDIICEYLREVDKV